MTDEEFDDWYATLTDTDKLQWLFSRVASLVFRDKQKNSYGINSLEDWHKMIEQ